MPPSKRQQPPLLHRLLCQRLLHCQEPGRALQRNTSQASQRAQQQLPVQHSTHGGGDAGLHQLMTLVLMKMLRTKSKSSDAGEGMDGLRDLRTLSRSQELGERMRRFPERCVAEYRQWWEARPWTSSSSSSSSSSSLLSSFSSVIINLIRITIVTLIIMTIVSSMQ